MYTTNTPPNNDQALNRHETTTKMSDAEALEAHKGKLTMAALQAAAKEVNMNQQQAFMKISVKTMSPSSVPPAPSTSSSTTRKTYKKDISTTDINPITGR
eukprot:CAMPEP_0117430524 /NCGR_PEP_ID=MMETSP0758-20121206/10072_1 /TAXON_ID=63605 /ORGANISM="Percolomonas cosmopolitus, Strain AE-1 (ATCC 50343)" /LENGTH=99 /DNA_ID=CAMNT_0005218647 /DNA_START=10 /DNA_END=305 /DNA_ORIENTATION=-